MKMVGVLLLAGSLCVGAVFEQQSQKDYPLKVQMGDLTDALGPQWHTPSGLPRPSTGLRMMRSAKPPCATMHLWLEPMRRDWKATTSMCTAKPQTERERLCVSKSSEVQQPTAQCIRRATRYCCFPRFDSSEFRSSQFFPVVAALNRHEACRLNFTHNFLIRDCAVN